MDLTYSIIDSTNLEALRWSDNNNQSSDVWFIAREQTGGVGQRNRTWSSPAGGIYTSVLYKTPSFLSSIGQYGVIALVAGNTVYELVYSLLVQNNIDTKRLKIHWPNDIYYQNCKLSGILTQSTTAGRLVTGFGINVNTIISSPSVVNIPISLTEILHKNLDLTIIYHQLQTEWYRQIHQAEQFVSGAFPEYITQTENKLAWLGESVSIIHTDESRQAPQSGVLLGLTEQGALRLQTDIGERVIVSGSVRKTES